MNASGPTPTHMTSDRTQAVLERVKVIAKREAWIAGALVGFGFLLLPACVYFVGDITLGAYGPGGIKEFYVNQYRAVADGNVAAWILALGPYAIVQLARLLWVPLARKPAEKSS